MANNQTKYSAEYNRRAYDTVSVRLKSGGKMLLSGIIADTDKSINAFMIRAARQALEDMGIDADTVRAICGD